MKTKTLRYGFAVFLLVLSCLSLMGCGGQGDDNSKQVQSKQSSSSRPSQNTKRKSEKPTQVSPISWNDLKVLTLRGHKDIVVGPRRLKAWVNSVAFSPDGKRLVSGSNDRTAKVWDAHTGEELLTLRGHSTYVTSAAFSPDGLRIVSGSYDRTVKVWNALTGKEHLTLRGHKGTVYSAAFSPDGKRIVSGGGIVADNPKSEVKVWNAATGKPLFSLIGHTSWVNSVAFSPDGRYIATGSDDATVKVWNAGTAKDIMTLRHMGNVQSVAFSPDGKRIASGGWDSTVKVWDAQSGKKLLTFRDHAKFVNEVSFSPDGKFVVSGSTDQTVKVVDVSTGKAVFSTVSNLTGGAGDDAAVWSVAFSPSGRRFASANADRTVKIWASDEKSPTSDPSPKMDITLDANPEVDNVVRRFNEIPTRGSDISYASDFQVPNNAIVDHLQGVGQIGNGFVLTHSHGPASRRSQVRPSLIFVDRSRSRFEWRALFFKPLVAQVSDSRGAQETHYLGHAGALQCIGNCVAVPFEGHTRTTSALVKIYRVVNREKQIVDRIQQIRVDPAYLGSDRSAAAVGITHDGSKYVMAVVNHDSKKIYTAYSESNKTLGKCDFTWVSTQTFDKSYQGGLSLVTEAGDSSPKRVWALGFYDQGEGLRGASHVDLLRFDSRSKTFSVESQKKLFDHRINFRWDYAPNCRWGASCTPETDRLAVAITCRGFKDNPNGLDDNHIRILRCALPAR